MQPVRVYGGIVQSKHNKPTGPIRRGLTTTMGSNNVSPVSGTSKPYDLQEARIRRAISRTKPLIMSDWNGHLEVTDECLLGLALFQVDTKDSISKEMHTTFKDGIKAKRVEIHRLSNFSTVKIYLFRRNYSVTIPDLMLKHMEDRGVEQYLSEYTLVSQLLEKIRKIDSVRDRWIPTFSPPIRSLAEILNQVLETPLMGPSFEIQGGYTMKPKTLGQWFLILLLERVRRQVTSGIGLRTLLYCVCWCARLVIEHDYDRLRTSAVMIKAWLLQGTCQDCVYKFLRELRVDYSFEYYFNIADSFSECIILPDMRTSVTIGNCDDKDAIMINQPGFLRTFGQHSFLTSPYSNKSLPVKVKVLEGKPPEIFHMTGRQTATLLTMLDLHARVLRASDWKQCKRAFSACLRERRANNGTSLISVMQQMVEDIVALSCLSSSLSTTVAHFSLLIFRGSLSVEMIQAYRRAQETTRLSAHSFIVRHCFLRAPTPDTQAYADMMYRTFINGNLEEQHSILQYTIEDSEHRYELCPEELNLAERWNIPDAIPEDEIVDHFDGDTVVFNAKKREIEWDESTSWTTEVERVHPLETDTEIKHEPKIELSADELAMLSMEATEPNDDCVIKISDHTALYDTIFRDFREPDRLSTSETSSSIIIPIDDDESIGHDDINRESEQ